MFPLIITSVSYFITSLLSGLFSFLSLFNLIHSTTEAFPNSLSINMEPLFLSLNTLNGLISLALLYLSLILTFFLLFRPNLLKSMIIIEIAFMSVVLLFLAFSILVDSIIGFVFIFFILSVAAVESALFLCIFLRYLILK